MVKITLTQKTYDDLCKKHGCFPAVFITSGGRPPFEDRGIPLVGRVFEIDTIFPLFIWVRGFPLDEWEYVGCTDDIL